MGPGKGIALILILVGAGALVATALGFVGIALREVTAGELGVLAMTLGIVALVIERAVEVYANTMFEPERNIVRARAAQLSQAIARDEKTLAAESLHGAGTEVRDRLLASLAARRDALSEEEAKIWDRVGRISARKGAFAMQLSTFLGLLAAISGVRVLGTFVGAGEEIGGELGRMIADGTEAEQALAALQMRVILFVDIVLTTGLLAGGSEAVHKVMKAIGSLKPMG